MPDLTTLQRVKRMIHTSTDDGSDDLMIQGFINAASTMVHAYCRRSFVPYRQLRVFDADGDDLEARVLELDEDLLEAITITNGDGTVIAGDAYILLEPNTTPYNAIALQPSSGLRWTYTTDWRGAIQIDGIWGDHDAYADAWLDTLDAVQDDPLAAGATTIAVADADGIDAYGTPRFEVLQYLKLDDEVVQVVAINTQTDTLTVRRAALGTTAAAHAAATPIRSYQPMEDIRMACTSLATWLYRTRESVGEKIQFLGGAQIITHEAPANIQTTLRKHVRWGRGL
ncbi:MAG: hypothetical protein Kow00120_00330 [Anaerolineae bacterium]